MTAATYVRAARPGGPGVLSASCIGGGVGGRPCGRLAGERRLPNIPTPPPTVALGNPGKPGDKGKSGVRAAVLKVD